MERLFSIAGMILSPQRCKMTNKLFDKMVFLKCCSLQLVSNQSQHYSCTAELYWWQKHCCKL